jgi:hypothetical protein
MFVVLQVVSVFLASVAMALSLAHALELPGKLRLDKEAYCAMQPIYYPGFTFGGGVGEGLGMLATLALLLMTPSKSSAFLWTIVGLIGLVATHATYWILTHPVNNFWLKGQDLSGIGGFFRFDPLKRLSHEKDVTKDDWKDLRDRWEYSHVLRAIFSSIALVALIVAVALK